MDLELIQVLGYGAAGVVFKAQWCGMACAVKVRAHALRACVRSWVDVNSRLRTPHMPHTVSTSAAAGTAADAIPTLFALTGPDPGGPCPYPDVSAPG